MSSSKWTNEDVCFDDFYNSDIQLPTAEDINHGKKNNSHPKNNSQPTKIILIILAMYKTQSGKSSDYVLNKSSFGSIESNRLSKKNRARAFNIKRAPQKQARYQYSGKFMSVFQ